MPPRHVDFKKDWRRLTQSAAWIVAVIGSVVLPPPTAALSGVGANWWRFAQLTATLSVGLMFVLTGLFKERRHVSKWGAAAVFSLVLAVAVVLLYDWLAEKWTCPYVPGSVILTGSELTEDGARYVREAKPADCHQMLMDFAGAAEEIWTRDSIARRRHILEALYSACVPLIACLIIMVLQAMRCAQARSRSNM